MKTVREIQDRISRLKKAASDGIGVSEELESQGAGAMGGLEIGTFAGCIIGGPIGCVVGASVGAVAGAGLGSFDQSIDYEAHTASGTFICQGAKCENLEEETYVKEGNVLTSQNCY